MSQEESSARDGSLGAAALELLLKQLPGSGLCLVDAAGTIEQWHISAERLLGHVAAQIETQRLETLFPEERRFEATLPRAMFEASARGHASIEGGLMTRGGQRRVCTLDLSPRLDAAGDVVGFIVLIRATAPGRAMSTSNSRDHLIFAHRSNVTQADNEPAWIGVDLNGRVSRLSKSAADWLGCDVEDPLGRDLSDCLRPTDQQLDWATVLHRSVRPQATTQVEVRSVEEAGGQARIARLLSLRADDGQLDGFTLVMTAASGPITPRPSPAARGNSTPIGDGGLIAAAHDLREPLRKLQHYAKQLQTREAPRLSSDGRRQLESMQAATERMQSMVGGMLRLARVETKKTAGRALDISGVVDEARADLGVLIEEHDAHLDVAKLGTVVGDADQLRALFQNLIDNSIRYRRDDARPRIRIVASEDTDELDRVQLDYIDNASGVGDPETIFSPFHNRSSRNNGEDHGGIGIGLPLCQRICRRHGGDLRVLKTSDQGTVFRITLNDLDNNSSA